MAFVGYECKLADRLPHRRPEVVLVLFRLGINRAGESLDGPIFIDPFMLS